MFIHYFELNTHLAAKIHTVLEKKSLVTPTLNLDVNVDWIYNVLMRRHYSGFLI